MGAVTPDRRFLVLHVWQDSRPPGHWQWQLVEALRSSGEQVLYPQLPEPDRPSPEAWTGVLRAELTGRVRARPAGPRGGLDLNRDVVPGGRHLDPDAGYGAWPSVLAGCRDPATRLVAR